MKQFKSFCQLLWQRFHENKLPITAGYLTYSTVLAIVPLIMVVFSVFTALPMFKDATNQLEKLIYSNFAPNAGEVVEEYIELFVSNSQQMGIISTVGLVVVALMLIHSVDKSLNEIWHNSRKRSILVSFLLYAVLLVTAPIAAGVSIAITSYIFSLSLFQDGVLSFSQELLKFAPFFLIWLMFTLIYWLVPNTEVKCRHAAMGAFFAAIFFTLGKQGFIWYITTFPSYQAIYGALAVLPIMLLWIQLSWNVVLLGGLFASVLKEWECVEKASHLP